MRWLKVTGGVQTGHLVSGRVWLSGSMAYGRMNFRDVHTCGK